MGPALCCYLWHLAVAHTPCSPRHPAHPRPAGGFAFGLAFGWVTQMMLRYMRRHGLGREQQIALTLAMGYMVYYVANSPGKASGVVAVAVYGLYGAATNK